VAAFLVGIEKRYEFEDLVGRPLLRSDVCYAGRGYCFALSQLNTPGAVAFLQRYLRYYLTRKDLRFDQGDAIAALRHLDELNGTDHSVEFKELWINFIK
jgi:hypothetical protein